MANHAEQVTRDIREAAVTASPVAKPSLIWNRNSGQAVLANGCLELIVEAKTGVNARSLRDLKSGHVYADLDYSWPGGAFPSTEKNPVITNHKDGSRSVLFAGRLGSIMVEQSFTAPVNEPGVILERITIRNATASPVATADFKCGFAKRICEADARLEDAVGTLLQTKWEGLYCDDTIYHVRPQRCIRSRAKGISTRKPARCPRTATTLMATGTCGASPALCLCLAHGSDR